jgi:deazaflavin-dependent oxidoreductase (nitroreductase family)
MDPKLARRVARFNQRFTNHLTAPLAQYLPGMGVVTQIGRKSGRTYRTPVNVFTHDEYFIFALTYGRKAQWVRNVLAAGGCNVTTRGQPHRLTRPEVFRDERQQAAALIARPILRMIGTNDFMRLRRET